MPEESDLLEQESARLSNAVYAATNGIETLEHERQIRGNSHHIRQKIAEFAVIELQRHWYAPEGHKVTGEAAEPGEAGTPH